MQCFVKASKFNCFTTIQLQILTFKLLSAKNVKLSKIREYANYTES